ncbi:hypothetical protein QQ020_31490 [Fulvivirgaceae bacterium BMA12]|uniref:Lipoprotein n=1 Tax=Agaribacillus aureus TaxID=3051825 RepID=A0ABT8LIR9_9BACT|nr:hypothetical protein [Fulvivirgaceae bacterium BMA12]
MKSSAVFLLILLVIGCNAKHSGSISDNVSNKNNIDFQMHHCYPDCKERVYKTLGIHVVHEDDIKMDQYILIVQTNEGTIYNGPYKEEINVDKICFCLDDNLSKITSISFHLVDKNNNQVYSWHKKNSYYLYEKDEMYVKLLNSGFPDSYKIKFSENWFYQ